MNISEQYRVLTSRTLSCPAGAHLQRVPLSFLILLSPAHKYPYIILSIKITKF